jgi:hypothetical protein
MKGIVCILSFLPLFLIGQEKYNWSNIDQVKFYDLTELGKDFMIESIDQIPKNIKYVINQTESWSEVLGDFSDEVNDVAWEYGYVLVVEFKDGTIIPFEFFPKQSALFDLRKGHFNYMFFNVDNRKKVNGIFKSCIDCIKDPDCN